MESVARALLILAALLAYSSACKYTGKVLLVSYAGLRYDYFNSQRTPNLYKFAQGGFNAKVTPTFMSKTISTHWSEVTGMYQENTGIVGDSFYDPDKQKTFTPQDNNASFWWEQNSKAPPIWVELTKQGRRVGIYYWPGSESAIFGERPFTWKTYDATVPFLRRAEEVMNWFTLGNSIDLGLMYWSHLERETLLSGLNSPEWEDALSEVDNSFGQLLSLIDDYGLSGILNIIVVGDHGIASTPKKNRIDLSKIVSMKKFDQVIDGATVMQLWPKSTEDPESLVATINSKANDRMTAYLKKDIPSRLRYNKNSRIAPIVIICEEGYTVYSSLSKDHNLANSGYDPALESMKTILLARGPNFVTTGEKLSNSINSVDIYPLLAELLSVTPRESDGSLESFTDYLVQFVIPTSAAPDRHQLNQPVFIPLLIALAFLSL